MKQDVSGYKQESEYGSCISLDHNLSPPLQVEILAQEWLGGTVGHEKDWQD
jgi:hypothetical protein